MNTDTAKIEDRTDVLLEGGVPEGIVLAFLEDEEVGRGSEVDDAEAFVVAFEDRTGQRQVIDTYYDPAAAGAAFGWLTGRYLMLDIPARFDGTINGVSLNDPSMEYVMTDRLDTIMAGVKRGYFDAVRTYHT